MRSIFWTRHIGLTKDDFCELLPSHIFLKLEQGKYIKRTCVELMKYDKKLPDIDYIASSQVCFVSTTLRNSDFKAFSNDWPQDAASSYWSLFTLYLTWTKCLKGYNTAGGPCMLEILSSNSIWGDPMAKGQSFEFGCPFVSYVLGLLDFSKSMNLSIFYPMVVKEMMMITYLRPMYISIIIMNCEDERRKRDQSREPLFSIMKKNEISEPSWVLILNVWSS